MPFPAKVCSAFLMTGLLAGCTVRFAVDPSMAPAPPANRYSQTAATTNSDSEAIPVASALPSTDNPLTGAAELSVDALVEQVLARNPSLAQMVAAWQAASARYPQVRSLDDPMLSGMVAPAS